MSWSSNIEFGNFLIWYTMHEGYPEGRPTISDPWGTPGEPPDFEIDKVEWLDPSWEESMGDPHLFWDSWYLLVKNREKVVQAIMES